MQRIAAATEGMRTELQAMLAEFGTTLGGAGDMLRQGGAAGAAAFTTSLGGAGQDLAQSVAGAASVLREVGDATSAALRQGGESAGARLDPDEKPPHSLTRRMNSPAGLPNWTVRLERLLRLLPTVRRIFAPRRKQRAPVHSHCARLVSRSSR